MTCLYCRRPSGSAKGLSHVFPEAVVANGVTLPIGAVCDGCNNYLSGLDTIIASHPYISLAVQFLGLPGKRRRVRQELGGVSRGVRPGWITVETSEPKTTVAPDGTSTTSYQPLIDSRFDLSGFRRALHHIALNSIAYRHGQEKALAAEYDEARRYVRFPRKGEEWGFAQHARSLHRIHDEVGIDHIVTGDHELVRIVAFNLSFYVDLRRPDGLKDVAMLDIPGQVDYLQPGYRLPRHGKGRTRYRISIELPGQQASE